MKNIIFEKMVVLGIVVSLIGVGIVSGYQTKSLESNTMLLNNEVPVVMHYRYENNIGDLCFPSWIESSGSCLCVWDFLDGRYGLSVPQFAESISRFQSKKH